MEALIKYFKANRGAQSALAKRLGRWPSTISQWKQVPVDYLAEVEEFTGIPREQLLPAAFQPAPSLSASRAKHHRYEESTQ
ncbi:YdaS family helix-turn-helix protein [Sinorhizobium chiapasense]|uniref:Helix-turn-helix domain-containing protein n=1 Tax=Sinorhizobium chiapasense TaxID=501572 RepID=A0ABZ2BAV0_9HYPH